MLKKFGAKSPKLWTNYAHFLHTTAAQPDRARALLKRATSVLGAANDTRVYLPLITKFASLEFHSPNGDAEQGRTLFENLLAAYPKKFDLWNQLLDLEMSATGKDGKEVKGQDLAVIRDVFERGARVKGLKARQAKTWFRRWAQWEEEKGDAKSRERVSAKAQEWARKAEERKRKAGEEEGEEEE
jgi:rRNA biogenesis protein RRP5